MSWRHCFKFESEPVDAADRRVRRRRRVHLPGLRAGPHQESTGRSSIVMLLLTGLAVNALFMSGIGFMAYSRAIRRRAPSPYWNLGTLSGANWTAVTIVGIGDDSRAASLAAFRYAKQLNALMIGEEEATCLGRERPPSEVDRSDSINVVMIAVATAFTGVIRFVGLIVPHILRMLKGADNRFLIVGSALMGGTLLSVADLVARLSLRPAELPIGIVTRSLGCRCS